MEKLGVEHLSASAVSRLSHGLDEKVAEFLSRPIELEIPYLFVDATYVKIRENCRYVTKALFIAVGIRTDGHREILGARLADSESENWWEVMFDELKERGLRGVKLVISDGHKGIRNAVESSFLGAAWQMCTVHYARAVRKKVPQKIQKDIAASLRDAEEDPEKLERIVQSLEELGYQSAANTVERFLHDVGNYRSFPEMQWKRIRTTNGVERINAEIKRRVRKVGSFPNEDSFMRLAVSILMNIDEEWMTGNRYLCMEVE